jgi:AcrR family transcriptional regulator
MTTFAAETPFAWISRARRLLPTLVDPAEIADRAGLTKRSFFNHFPDKREVLFAGARAFEASVLKYLAEAGDDVDPIDAAVTALTRVGLDLARYGDYAQARQRRLRRLGRRHRRRLPGPDAPVAVRPAPGDQLRAGRRREPVTAAVLCRYPHWPGW